MRATQLQDLLTPSRWNQLDLSMQEEAAHAVAAQLPEPFRFDGLETHELGTLRHRVAFFTWNRWRFALIPGVRAILGYAPNSFHPTAAQQASWEETRQKDSDFALEYPTLESHLVRHLTPLRQVTLQPFLLEVEAQEIDVQFPESYQAYPSLTRPFLAWQIQQDLARHGFRLPTSDEWEYACAAGMRTLWRWGNETPMVKMVFQRNTAVWDLHLHPNAFGVMIGDDPSRWEFTAERGVMRGGDGGNALHVGSGHFVEWFTLASPFWVPLDPEIEGVHRGSVRRAYSLFG